MRVAKLAPRLRQGRERKLEVMAKILVNVTNGPEHPTRAALAFLVARSAQESGHEITLFLAGDAVHLLREPVLDSLVGLGTGSLRESYDALREGSARWYVSGMSSKARGFEPNGIAEAVPPAKLVELALEADRVLTY
jgi:predicted peroxiredoxin